MLDDATDVIGRDVVAASRDEDALATTEFVQPAILACDVAALRVLEAFGVGFVGAAGHSASSPRSRRPACSRTDALRIVAVRGRAMQAGEARPGTMTALLGVGSSDAAALCDEARGDDVLLVANENSPQQVVISGSVAAIERARPSPPTASSGSCA